MPSLSKVRLCQPLLGTYVTLTVEDPRPEEELVAITGAAFETVARVGALMSFHDPTSELSRLNLTAHIRPVPVDPWTWQVLSLALEIARASQGAFDPTVASLLEKWGFLPALSGQPSGLASYRDIELLTDRTVRFHRALHLDLGGIAKGFAIDQAIAIFQDHGIASAVVDAGGDLRLHGIASQNPPPLQVRHPRHPMQHFLSIPMLAPAAASTAGYFATRRYRLRRVTHLVNPFTRRPALSLGSVTVFAPLASLADALTKVVLFSPPSEWPVILASYQAHAIRINQHGKVESETSKHHPPSS